MNLYYNNDDSDYVVFRTGEMYLNAAEAAFEIGKLIRAKQMLNAVRNRVGMPPKQVATLANIKKERFCELFGENHHIWDLKTWRGKAAIHMKPKWGVKWLGEDLMECTKQEDGDGISLRTQLFFQKCTGCQLEQQSLR